MSVTRIGPDDDALDRATHSMGATTDGDTVDTARGGPQRAQRMVAAQRLLERGQRGDFDQAATAHTAAKAARKKVFEK